MPTISQRLKSPRVLAALTETLEANYDVVSEHYTASAPDLVDALVARLEAELSSNQPTRQFVPAHLGLIYLLAEHSGATHTRLRRLWDAKAARSGPLAWKWISDSGLRTRCSELVTWGIVEDTGAHGQSATGRPSAIWTLVGVDPASLGRTVEPVPGIHAGVASRLEALLDEAGDDMLIRSQLEFAARVAGVTS